MEPKNIPFPRAICVGITNFEAFFPLPPLSEKKWRQCVDNAQYIFARRGPANRKLAYQCPTTAQTSFNSFCVPRRVGLFFDKKFPAF